LSSVSAGAIRSVGGSAIDDQGRRIGAQLPEPDEDPSVRLVTLVQERRARALLDHIDTMFTK